MELIELKLKDRCPSIIVTDDMPWARETDWKNLLQYVNHPQFYSHGALLCMIISDDDDVSLESYVTTYLEVTKKLPMLFYLSVTYRSMNCFEYLADHYPAMISDMTVEMKNPMGLFAWLFFDADNFGEIYSFEESERGDPNQMNLSTLRRIFQNNRKEEDRAMISLMNQKGVTSQL